MGTLPTPETPIVNIAHLGGIAAPEHLAYQAIIVAAIVPRVGACKAVPMVGKDLFEDAPRRRRGYRHEAASECWIVCGSTFLPQTAHWLHPVSGPPQGPSFPYLALVSRGREANRQMENPMLSRDRR